MEGRVRDVDEELAPCTAEPVQLDSYRLASHIPITPQLPPSLWTSQEHLISHSLRGTHRAQHPPTLLPVLLVWCYWAAHRLKPHGAVGAEPSSAKIAAFESSAFVKCGKNLVNQMGLNS